VTTLRLQLTLREQGYLVSKTTNNLEAYDYVLRGIECIFRFTKEANAQARQMFEKALELDPQYAAAYTFLGSTYWLERAFGWSPDPQNLERALELAQKALALDDSLPVAHSLLSLLYAQQQQLDQALAEGERAIALDPNNADRYGHQADVMLNMGRPEEALALMEKAIRLNPRYPPLYLYRLGRAYRLTGRYADAITAQKQGLLRNPNYFFAYTELALSYGQQWVFQLSHDPQDLEQALVAAQRALALNDSLPFAHQALGDVYLWRKQYEQAITEIERAVALDPDSAFGYADLAIALSSAGKPGEAIGQAEQAIRLIPSRADWLSFSLGYAYHLAGRLEEAVAPLQRFATRFPHQLFGHLHLAAVYSELGREAEARAEAAEVLRINPKFSLEVHKERVPIKDPAMLERHLAALRRAGLK
jgi:tetratricopeptide (TPR) repeat protein